MMLFDQFSVTYEFVTGTQSVYAGNEALQLITETTPPPFGQVQIASNGQTYIRVANCQTVRMKEEKEVLEHFAGVFTMMNPLTFKEIFQTTVPYMVERISKNYALQVSVLALDGVVTLLFCVCM